MVSAEQLSPSLLFLEAGLMNYPFSRVTARNFLTLALCSLIILGTAPVQAADPEVAAVQATVYDYFDGINTKDRARLESAFDTSAQLKSPDGDGAVKVEPIADAIARWMGGEAQSRKGKILALEITDNQVAQVVFDYDGIFVDFLTLFKLDGQWKIVDKSFIPQ
jgi:hypothetical protein